MNPEKFCTSLAYTCLGRLLCTTAVAVRGIREKGGPAGHPIAASPRHHGRRNKMSNFSYGLVITVIGMGGTVVSLWLITLVVDLLKRAFPYRESEEKERKEVA
jgi:hypothetical protein